MNKSRKFLAKVRVSEPTKIKGEAYLKFFCSKTSDSIPEWTSFFAHPKPRGRKTSCFPSMKKTLKIPNSPSSIGNQLIFLNKDKLPAEAEDEIKNYYKEIQLELAQVKQLNAYIKSMNLKFKLIYDSQESSRIWVESKFNSILKSGIVSIKDMKDFLYKGKEIHLIKNEFKHDYRERLTPKLGTKIKNFFTL